MIGLLEVHSKLAQVYMLSMSVHSLLDLDDAFRNSIFRVLKSFGEMPGLLRIVEFMCRFDESNLARFWDLAVGRRNPPAPEYRHGLDT